MCLNTVQYWSSRSMFSNVFRKVRISPKPTPEHLPCSRSVIRVHQPLNQGPRAVAHQKPEQRAQQKWIKMVWNPGTPRSRTKQKGQETFKKRQIMSNHIKDMMNKIRRLHAYKVAPLQDTPQQVPLQCPPHVSQAFLSRTTSLAKRVSRGADEEHVRRINSIPTLAHVSESPSILTSHEKDMLLTDFLVKYLGSRPLGPINPLASIVILKWCFKCSNSATFEIFGKDFDHDFELFLCFDYFRMLTKLSSHLVTFLETQWLERTFDHKILRCPLTLSLDAKECDGISCTMLKIWSETPASC